MRRGAWRAVVLALCACAGGAHALEGIVTRVSDGDTLWVRPLDGARPVKVRVQGIDAPEICQPWGREAKLALQALVQGHVVRLDRDGLRDEHGRLLGRLLRGDEDIGARLVREGHAWSHRWRRDGGPYLIEEVDARSARRGLFADPRAVHPRDFRRRHGPCDAARADVSAAPAR